MSKMLQFPLDWKKCPKFVKIPQFLLDWKEIILDYVKREFPEVSKFASFHPTGRKYPITSK
jgi:hypothetical protein